MEEKTPKRIMTVFQLVLAVLLFACMSIIFVNQAIIHFRDLFLSSMFLAMLLLSWRMLVMAVRETKEAFS